MGQPSPSRSFSANLSGCTTRPWRALPWPHGSHLPRSHGSDLAPSRLASILGRAQRSPYVGFIWLFEALWRCRWPFCKSYVSGRMRSVCDGIPPGGSRGRILAPAGPPNPFRRHTNPFPQQAVPGPAGRSRRRRRAFTTAPAALPEPPRGSRRSAPCALRSSGPRRRA